jgi:hypothetical protein
MSIISKEMEILKKNFKMLGRLRSEGSQLEVSFGKMYMRPHLNRQQGTIAHSCHPHYMGS